MENHFIKLNMENVNQVFMLNLKTKQNLSAITYLTELKLTEDLSFVFLYLFLFIN